MYLSFLRDSKVFLVFRVITMLGWLISLYILTHIFSPETYGLFFLISTSVLLGTSFSTTWVTSSIMRFYPEIVDEKKISKFVVESMLLVFLSTLVVCIFISIILYLTKTDFIASYLLSISFIWLAFNSLNVSILTFFRIRREVLNYSVLNFCHLVGSLLLGVIFLFIYNNSLFYLILGICFGNILVFILLCFILFKKQMIEYQIQLKLKPIFWKFFTFGLGSTFINFFSLGLSHTDKFLVADFLGEKENGIYSAIYQLAEPSIFAIISIFSFVSTPILYQLWLKKNKPDVTLYLRKILSLYLTMITPILCVIFLFYNEIGLIVIGINYSESFYLIPIISLGAAFVGLATLYTDVLTSAKKIFILAKCYFYAFTLNLVLNFFLIEYFGIFGSSIVSLISYLILFLFVVFEAKKIIPIEMDKIKIFKTLLLGSLLYICFFYLKGINFLPKPFELYETIFLIIFFIPIYLIFMIKFGVLSLITKKV